MLRPRIRHSVGADIAEHQSIARSAAMIDSQSWEARFAALEVLVEIDEERGGALTETVDFIAVYLWVEKVAVEQELLTDRVTQHL